MNGTMILGLLCLFPIAQHLIQFFTQITDFFTRDNVRPVEYNLIFSIMYWVVIIGLLFTSYWWVSIGMVLIQYVVSFILSFITYLLTKSKKLVILFSIILNFISGFLFLYVILNEWYFRFDWSPLDLF